MSRSPKVTYGFVSFTEVEPGEHRSYNQWHLFDHLPEQLPLAGVVWGQRWVLPPALRRFMRAGSPLDRVHYVTLYLLAEPASETVAEFFALAGHLRELGRFHLQRTSHLSGPLPVRSCTASARALVSGQAIPYRPNTGAHVRLESGAGTPHLATELVDLPGVAGVWTMGGDGDGGGGGGGGDGGGDGGDLIPPALRGLTATWCWLDGDPHELAPRLAELADASDELLYCGTLASIDPWGRWDWFDVDG